MSNIGNKIKQSRQSKGLSCRALSRIARVSFSYLNEVENNNKVPTLEYVKKLEQILEVDLVNELIPLSRLSAIESLSKEIVSDKGIDVDWNNIASTDMMIALNNQIEKDVLRVVKDYRSAIKEG